MAWLVSRFTANELSYRRPKERDVINQPIVDYWWGRFVLQVGEDESAWSIQSLIGIHKLFAEDFKVVLLMEIK